MCADIDGFSREVEAVLAAHPAVQDVAVIGVPDAKWGEAVMAIVVPMDGAEPRQDDLEAWCRERIAGFKRPRAYAFITRRRCRAPRPARVQHRLLREQTMAAMAEPAR